MSTRFVHGWMTTLMSCTSPSCRALTSWAWKGYCCCFASTSQILRRSLLWLTSAWSYAQKGRAGVLAPDWPNWHIKSTRHPYDLVPQENSWLAYLWTQLLVRRSFVVSGYQGETQENISTGMSGESSPRTLPFYKWVKWKIHEGIEETCPGAMQESGLPVC